MRLGGPHVSTWTPDGLMCGPRGSALPPVTRALPHVATSPCHFLPLLPPITRTVKLRHGASRLEFGVCRQVHSQHTANNGKNGNVQCRGQHCRPDHLTPTRGPAHVGCPRRIVVR